MAGAVIKTLTGVVAPVAINGYFGIQDYKQARKQGDSKATSLVKAATSFAVGEIMGFGTLPVFLAPALVQGTSALWQQNAKIMGQGYNQKGKFGSGYFPMTEAGYTMRQRSLNAIRSNGLNVQSALGNEARTYFHSV